MQSIITTTLYLLTALIPLTFTTINLELFEFPKFIILLSGSLVIATAWLIHIYTTGDYKIIPSQNKWISYSLLAFLATQIITTIFSIHPYTSFWGYYSRFHGGLLTTICYTLIYFAALKWLNKRTTQNIIKVSVGTSILIGLYAILEHFGIDKNFWIQDVQNRVFSTLGQPNWLAAYAVPNIFLVLYLSHTKQLKSRALTYSLFLILFTTILFTKSRSGFLALLLSYGTYWFLLARQFTISKIFPYAIRYTLYAILVIAIFGSPYTPSIARLSFSGGGALPSPVPTGTALETGGTESGDIRKIVWTGALRLIGKYPVLGTGPETFAYTYYWTRPLAHNMTSEWDFLYNKAHNEYLNIGAGSGLLGLLAYLGWHASMIGVSLARRPRTKKVAQDQDDNLRHFAPVLGASVVAFTITSFFGFSVIPVFLMLILVSIFPTTLTHNPSVSTPVSPIITLVVLLPLIYTSQLFLADLSYAKGKQYLDVGQPGSSVKFLQKAVKTRPGLDLFHATLGEAYAMTGQTDQALQELSINRQLNPYHLNYYKSRAKIYLTLATNDPSYHVQAATELEEARKLAPTDPKLAYNLGLVYTRIDAIDKAEVQLQEAIALKPNYAEPYYALTLLYEQTNQTAKIPDLLRDIDTKLATYSGALLEKIDKYTTK